MSLDLRPCHKKLKKKWFKIEDWRDDYYCRFYIDGKIKTTICSKVGGHSKQKYKTLPDWMISKIYKDLHFNNQEQFFGFLDCDPTKENYQQMLLDKGKIRP